MDVDEEEVRSRLRKLGARLMGKYNFKRVVFNVSVTPKVTADIRVRTDGKNSFITLKKRYGDGLSDRDEYELGVKDFREAARMLNALFGESKYSYYVENRREEYLLGGSHVTIDKWPQLPAFVEIEGRSEKDIISLYNKLKIKGKYAGNISAGDGYRRYGLNFFDIVRKNKKKLDALVKG